MQTLAYVGFWVYLARGLTADLLRYSVVTAVLKVAFIVAGGTISSIGVAGGIALAAALEWPLSLWWLNRRTALPARALALGAARVLLLAVASGVAVAVVVAAVSSGPVVRLAVALATGAAVYALAAIVPVVRRDLHDVLAVVRRALRRRVVS
jgi:PST family polysaccharide transporter